MEQGDTINVTFLTSGFGDPIDLTGASVFWRAYTQKHGVVDKTIDPLIEKAVGSGITIVPSPPSFVVALDREDTIDLSPDVYYHEVTVVNALHEYITVSWGLMTITETENRP